MTLPDRIWVLLAALLALDIGLLIWLLRGGLGRKSRRGGYVMDRWKGSR